MVFGVSAAKTIALEEDCEIRVIYTPKPPFHPHASVFGLPDDYDEAVMLATALVDLITQADINRAVLP